MTTPAKLRIMDLVQEYANAYAVSGQISDGSDTAKRIKLEINVMVSRLIEDAAMLLATVRQDHTILRNAQHLMMSDTVSNLELLNYRDGIEESMVQLDLRRDSLIQWLKADQE